MLLSSQRLQFVCMCGFQWVLCVLCRLKTTCRFELFCICASVGARSGVDSAYYECSTCAFVWFAPAVIGSTRSSRGCCPRLCCLTCRNVQLMACVGLLSRLDMCLMPRGFEFFDPGHRTYVGFLLLDYYYRSDLCSGKPVATALACRINCLVCNSFCGRKFSQNVSIQLIEL